MKSILVTVNVPNNVVAPYVGAWIEITKYLTTSKYPLRCSSHRSDQALETE